MDRFSFDEQVMQFVEAIDWNASEQLILQHGKLLAPEAEKSLDAMVEAAKMCSDTALASCLHAHRAVLRRCQQTDPASTFKEISVAASAWPEWLPSASNPDRLKMDGVRRRYCEGLDAIATALRKRYQEAKNPTDLDIAVKMHLAATNLNRESSTRGAELLDGLGLDLSLRYDLTSNREDLDAAIAAWLGAVKLSAPSPEYAADYRLNLAGSLLQRFSQDNNPADVEHAIVYLEEAAKMVVPGSGRHALALSWLEEARREFLQKPNEALAKDEAKEAVRLGQLLSGAQTLYAAGKYPAAAELWRQAELLVRSLGGGDRPEMAKILNNRAAAEYKMGHAREAIKLYQNTLVLLGGESGHDQADLGYCLLGLGAIHVEIREYGAAERCLSEALAMWRRNPQWGREGLAAVLHALGLLRESLADYDEAKELFRQELALWAENPDERPIESGRCIADLAELHRARGEYSMAEFLYRKALEVTRQDVGEKHADFAAVLNGFGLLCCELGERQRAIAFLRNALEIRTLVLGPEHQATATSLNSLGAILQQEGQTNEARDLLTRALSARRNNATPDPAAIARTLNNLAFGLEIEGNYQEAEALLDESLELRSKAWGPCHPQVAVCQIHLGSLRARQGLYGEAERLLLGALDSFGHISDRHPGTLDATADLAGVYAATGRPGDALELMQRAISMGDWLMRQVFSVGSEAQRMACLEQTRVLMDFYLSIVWRYFPGDPVVARTAMDLVMRRKGLGLETLATQRDALRMKHHEHLRPRLREVRATRASIARAMLEAAAYPDASNRKELLDDLQERLRRLEAELAMEIPEMRLDGRLEQVSTGLVADLLPPDAALIEYVRVNPFDFEAKHAVGESPLRPSRYLAFVVVSGKPEQAALIDLGEASEIEELVRAFRQWMSRLAGGGRHVGSEPKEGLAATDRCAEELRGRVFDAIRKQLGTRTRLFIAPDGELNLIPFEALPMQDGRYIIDDYVISYLAAGRDLIRLNERRHANAGPPMVIADPDFDLADSGEPSVRGDGSAVERGKLSRAMSGGNLRFEPLAEVRFEAERIAGLLGVKARTREQAREGPLKSCTSPRILHIATHGFFFEDQDARARESPRFLEVEGKTQASLMSRMENPLLRSGLALAGANTFLSGKTVPADAEDGLLTAEDVTGMDLSGTQLVVLSACETGLGEVRVGEGVFGLRRAFDMAGAETLVMSLWKVPDRQTRELMEEYYVRLLQDGPRAESLREAQRAIKARYLDSVHCWGAFICQGKPGPLSSPGNVCAATT